MQRYARNQSKRVAENKIVMETNANKTTLFLQLMRKRCFLSVLNLLAPPATRALLIILVNIIEEDRESFFE